jgi:hypothetical protein
MQQCRLARLEVVAGADSAVVDAVIGAWLAHQATHELGTAA